MVESNRKYRPIIVLFGKSKTCFLNLILFDLAIQCFCVYNKILYWNGSMFRNGQERL